MEKSEKLFRLEGSIQHYDWGGKTFLPELLHLWNEDGKPFAEYWMGAHLKSPSTVFLADGSSISLPDLIRKDPGFLLGEQAASEFGALPFLLKAQDVRHMLSIQVHPTKENAALKFREENEKGIPLEAANRNYKDNNHKPELLSPLSDFYLLHGFKEPAKLRAVLEDNPELQFLLPYFDNDNYEGLYAHVMRLSQQEVNQRLEPLIQRVSPLYNAGVLEKTDEGFWTARAAQTFSVNGQRDRGIFSIYFFNIVQLRSGDALFQDAGLPHAYLEGHTIEIMANSDNVLRGGLTPKHIDVDELLQHVLYQPTIPNVILGNPITNRPEVFKTPARDFELTRIELEPEGTCSWNSTSAEILFVYNGKAIIENGETKLETESGEALLAAAGADIRVTATDGVVLYRAGVPE